MEDETKDTNETWQKVAPLLSLSEQERLRYLLRHISELQKPQLSELEQLLHKVIASLEKHQRKEATWTKHLKQRLEKEGWQDISVALGTKQGPDLKAHKGKRTVIMEVKGEPSSSAKVNDVLGEILNRMRTQSSDVCYCVAFPDSYLPVVKRRLPNWVREKLSLYILFLKGDSL